MNDRRLALNGKSTHFLRDNGGKAERVMAGEELRRPVAKVGTENQRRRLTPLRKIDGGGQMVHSCLRPQHEEVHGGAVGNVSDLRHDNNLSVRRVMPRRSTPLGVQGALTSIFPLWS